MTDLEKRAIRVLQEVAMTSKNWHANRAGFLYTQLSLYPNAPLRATQAGDLWFLVWAYRRQIADREVVAEADRVVNGALTLHFAMEAGG